METEVNRLRSAVVLFAVGLILMGAVHPALIAAPIQPVGTQLLGGALGGVVGVGLGILAISEIVPTLEPRAARVATVVAGVTLGGGLGATAGVLAASKIRGAEGNVFSCLLGSLAGGLMSAFVEPLLYLFGVPEATTEFLGFLLLPICPAIGATIGFNRNATASH